jgi:hypothetical protein
MSDIDIDRDGTYCAVADWKGVSIWDLKSGHSIGPGIVSRGYRFARFLKDPHRVLLGHITRQRPPYVINIETCQNVFSVSKRPNLTCLDVSEDGSVFAAGYADGTARLCSSTDGTPASRLFDHPRAVSKVVIDPTRRWLVTLTGNALSLSSTAVQKLHLWDANMAEELAELCLASFELPFPTSRPQATHNSPPLAVWFAPNGGMLNWLTDWGLLVSIPLDSNARTLARARDEVAIRAGTEVDSAGGLRLLEPPELAARWANLTGGAGTQPLPTSVSQSSASHGSPQKAPMVGAPHGGSK